jgi:hypothetical protein
MTALIATFEVSTLIEMALAGRTECFSVWMDRYVTAVRKHIMPLVKNTSDVDDLASKRNLDKWSHAFKKVS